MIRLNQNACDDRIDRAIEGLLSPEELTRFREEVLRDDKLRADYVERAWLHGVLQADRDSLVTLIAEEPVEVHAISQWGWVAAAGLAAALAVMAGVGWLTRTPSPVATLIQAENTKWAGSSLPTLAQSRLGPGTFALVEGIATVRFESGAVVTLEAPTTFEILSAMHCRLLEGSLTAEVPESAHGFAVDTADLRVIDLGTRFGVTAGSTGNSHVFVFKGEVALNEPTRSEPRRLTEGKSYHIASGLTASNLEPNRPQLPQVTDGWTSLTTSVGRGQDTYVRRGTTVPAGSQPLLMVKHTELEHGRKNERRVMLAFDLGDLATHYVTDAQLVLDPEPSGLGFITMVPDSKFAVYGVAEDVDWSENSLIWDSMPAFDDGGSIEGQSHRLAEFWIPRGGSGAPLTVRGDALAAFVRERRGKLATFVIVRETGETDTTGLVHAFASKEHPTSLPPTLRVR